MKRVNRCITIADCEPLKHRVGFLSGFEIEPSMRIKRVTLAVDYAGAWVSGSGPYGDGLAEKVYVPVAIALEDSIGQLDDVSA